MEDPYAGVSDSALAARFDRGDGEALNALCRRHYPHVFRWAYRLTQNVAEAEDCAQVAFTQFIRSWARWHDRERGAGPWLATIVRHVVVDRWQQEFRMARVADPDLLVAAGRSEMKPGPDDNALHREFLGAVEQALARVEAPCRELIELLFRERLTQREAAEKLGISHEAAKKRYQRCLQRVQSDLNERGFL